MIKLSVLSGCAWGLIAYFLGHRAFGNDIWGGIIAAPLIGGLIGHVSRTLEDKARGVQILISLFDLYLAATCFAIAMAAFDLLWTRQNVTLPAVVFQNVLGVLWGLTFTGYFLLLWPLSLFNHDLVWNRDGSPLTGYRRRSNE